MGFKQGLINLFWWVEWRVELNFFDKQAIDSIG